MPNPAYSVQFRPEVNLVDTAMHSVLTMAQAEAYMDERAAGYARYRIRPGHRMRIDMGDNPAQSNAVVTYMDLRVRDFPLPGKIAVVTSGAIARLQARRAVYLVNGNRRLFEDPDAALAWLLEDMAD